MTYPHRYTVTDDPGEGFFVAEVGPPLPTTRRGVCTCGKRHTPTATLYPTELGATYERGDDCPVPMRAEIERVSRDLRTERTLRGVMQANLEQAGKALGITGDFDPDDVVGMAEVVMGERASLKAEIARLTAELRRVVDLGRVGG